MAIELARLTAVEPPTGGHVGTAVAVSGDVAVLGAPGQATVYGPSAGAVFMYVRSGGSWRQTLRLTAYDGKPYAGFGSSVALAGDVLAVGVRDGGPGAVYMFHLESGEWRPRFRIAAPPAISAGFGVVLWLGQGLLLAGAPYNGAGAVHAYRRADTEWVSDGGLVAGDGTRDDNFGAAVAFSADTAYAVVGAPLHHGPSESTRTGAAYVFRRNENIASGPSSWYQVAKLTAPGGDADYGDYFGASVAISGFTALVGAPQAGPFEDHVGRVHAYELRDGVGWAHQQTLAAGDPGLYDAFGSTIALAGGTAVIGAQSDDGPGGADAGSVYVFRRIAGVWAEQAKLVAEQAARNDRLGASLSYDGATVVAGAAQDATASGRGFAAVYVEAGDTWARQATLTAVEPSARDAYGEAVAMAGELVAVGAPDDDPGPTEDAGALYLHRRIGNQWPQFVRVRAGDPANGARFGASVSASDDTVAVGAPADVNFGPPGPGWAYVFVVTGGTVTQQAKLIPEDGSPKELFGASVGLSGNALVVGARLADTPAGDNAGAVYVYERINTTWTRQAKLFASDARPGDFFGSAVAIAGDTMVVGASGRDGAAGRDCGAVYVFVRSGGGWVEQARLTAAAGRANDGLGFSVAISGDTVVAGAPGRRVLPNTPGHAHVFVRAGAIWTEQATLAIADAPPNGHFGSAVAVSGNTALLASPQYGAVHVFARLDGVWRWREALAPATGDPEFGSSLAFSGGIAVVGARSAHAAAEPNAGAVHLFAVE